MDKATTAQTDDLHNPSIYPSPAFTEDRHGGITGMLELRRCHEADCRNRRKWKHKVIHC